MEYTSAQLENLRKLSRIFSEEGYRIFDLRMPKHSLEFVAWQGPTNVGSAVVRLYRGRVRIQLFHAQMALFNFRGRIEKRFPQSEVFFSDKIFNSTQCGNIRTWEDLARKDPLELSGYNG